MVNGAGSEYLSRCVLVVLLTWIFARGRSYSLPHRLTFAFITPFNIAWIQEALNAHIVGRNLRWIEVFQQASHLRGLLDDPEYEDSHSKSWTIRFNWLMNAAIIYVGATSQPITRNCLQPRPLPVAAMSRWFSEYFGIPFTIQDLEYHITRWVIMLSSAAGEVQDRLDPSAPRVEGNMARYLGVPLSPLAPYIAQQLCGPFRVFHEEVVQWYPPRVWENRLTPMSPFDTSTDLDFHSGVDTTDHYLPSGLCVRQFIPRHERRDLPVIMWFAGGGWMLGDISGDNNVLSQIAARCGCRVFTGAYRRQEFPIPHDDAMVMADWVKNRVGRKEVVIAGVSSGGNLAAATALAWSAAQRPPAGLLLVAPSLDNTSECEERWRPNWDAPWLTPATMRFFQDRCFRSPGDRSRENWRASPIYADQRTIESTRAFPTKVVAMAGDILRRESEDFVARLEAASCQATLSIFPHGHTGLLMQGLVGTALLDEMIDWIRLRTSKHTN
ncbi:hypothetical protein, variant [Cladophialophora immunda]|uniref:Alpha/beta hydrolase fold-3 domain-containing protein n=1 Tax=Cladophialophora immunda TaxID=569365 RepID=A0A0D1ZCF4_9EURO|nr:uncharacterized protein PV07_08590 [Cladophialophora immunda]XP_016245633.1 hypothetical protein, variant [Cladophialophora immunda]KIW25416.1 hypothetical protein PV07_08590 [Cladophialophora immunda]KIW25417.1 hypothetical protein, variant [Cladophialophora immunda]